jgi:hypothetical protein
MAAFAAIAVPIATAGAEDPKPTPCNGVLIKDAAGDQDVAPVGGGSAGLPHGSVGPDNIDIRGLFFNLAPGADGKPVATANIQIQNLTSVVPPEANEGEVRYLVDFGQQGDISSLTAILSASGWKFVAAVPTDLPDPLGSVQINEVEIKGKVFEGKDGVIQMEFPESALIKDGTAMTGVITRISLGDLTVVFVSDQAPDGGTADAVSFTLKACPTPGGTATPATGGGTTPPSTTPPSSQSGPPAQPPAGQPGPNSLPVAGPLTFDVAVDKGKRATARKRGLRARVRCTVQCKVVATATISKATAKKLKLGKKALKIGTGTGTIVQPGRIPFYIKLTAKTKKALARKGVKKFPLAVAFSVTDLNGKQVKKVTKKSTLR